MLTSSLFAIPCAENLSLPERRLVARRCHERNAGTSYCTYSIYLETQAPAATGDSSSPSQLHRSPLERRWSITIPCSPLSFHMPVFHARASPKDRPSLVGQLGLYSDRIDLP